MLPADEPAPAQTPLDEFAMERTARGYAKDDLSPMGNGGSNGCPTKSALK